MEREFLKAINHSLHVDVNRFISWIRIMQSFFIQREHRFERTRRSQLMPPVQTHSPSLPGKPQVYGRARSASPEPFQFTFVPPISQDESSAAPTHGLPPSVAGRSLLRRPVTQHSYPPITDSTTWRPSNLLAPIDTSGVSMGTKRSAAEAFSPRSAQPPARPPPDDRLSVRHPIHPLPRRGHAQHYHPQPTSRRTHTWHQQQSQPSRPSTAVEVHFARMTLSGGATNATGPSPGLTSSSAAALPSIPNLTAPYDPHSAPSFRRSDGEPLELEYYQLVQGGRGVRRYQPAVAIEDNEVDEDGFNEHRESYIRATSSAPGSTSNYVVNLAGDNDESGSSSGSTIDAPWEQHEAYSQQQQQQQRRPPPPPPQSGPYSLPPLSTVLAESRLRFSSPPPIMQDLPNSQRYYSDPTPYIESKYAQFANAGPPASHPQQWGYSVYERPRFVGQFPPPQRMPMMHTPATFYHSPAVMLSPPAWSYPHYAQPAMSPSYAPSPYAYQPNVQLAMASPNPYPSGYPYHYDRQ